MDNYQDGESTMHGWEHTDENYRCLGLYAATLALELPVLLARYLTVWLVVTLALHVSGHGEDSAAPWAQVAAFGPIAWSALALLTPRGGGWWWRERSGGREPSRGEQAVFNSAMKELQAQAPILLQIPDSWFVLDDARPDASVYGAALMLSTGALALQDGQLRGLLAHELGHLRSFDARLTVALNRLVLEPSIALTLYSNRPLTNHLARSPYPLPSGPHAPSPTAPSTPGPTSASPAPSPTRPRTPGFAGSHPPGLMRWLLNAFTTLLRGGLGLRLLAPAWAAVWREQEYAADRWAASIGQGEPLAEFLQTHALALDHPTPLMSLSSHTYPPVQLRIDRLSEHGGEQQGGQCGTPWI
jgi:hypothetical protein